MRAASRQAPAEGRGVGARAQGDRGTAAERGDLAHRGAASGDGQDARAHGSGVSWITATGLGDSKACKQGYMRGTTFLHMQTNTIRRVLHCNRHFCQASDTYAFPRGECRMYYEYFA